MSHEGVTIDSGGCNTCKTFMHENNLLSWRALPLIDSYNSLMTKLASGASVNEDASRIVLAMTIRYVRLIFCTKNPWLCNAIRFGAKDSKGTGCKFLALETAMSLLNCKELGNMTPLIDVMTNNNDFVDIWDLPHQQRHEIIHVMRLGASTSLVSVDPESLQILTQLSTRFLKDMSDLYHVAQCLKVALHVNVEYANLTHELQKQVYSPEKTVSMIHLNCNQIMFVEILGVDDLHINYMNPIVVFTAKDLCNHYHHGSDFITTEGAILSRWLHCLGTYKDGFFCVECMTFHHKDDVDARVFCRDCCTCVCIESQCSCGLRFT